MSQVPKTIGGAIPEEAILGVERENGFLPTLPEWIEHAITVHKEIFTLRLALTDTAVVMINSDYGGMAYLTVTAVDSELIKDKTPAELKPLILRSLLPRVEAALPVLRTLVAALPEDGHAEGAQS
jgi:hypothetical protein